MEEQNEKQIEKKIGDKVQIDTELIQNVKLLESVVEELKDSPKKENIMEQIFAVEEKLGLTQEYLWKTLEDV